MPIHPALSPLRALIFDMDGTLYRHAGLARSYQSSIYASLAKARGITLERARELFEMRYQQRQKKTGQELSKLSVLAELGVTDLQWAKSFGRVRPENYLKPDERLQTTLQALRENFRLGLVTNNHRSNTLATLQALGIADAFDARLTLSESRCFKPSSRIFQHMADTLQVDPADCLSIGDRVDLDLKPAGKIHMQTYWVKRMTDLYRLPKLVKPKLAAHWVAESTSVGSTVVRRVARLLQKGRLVVLPTDTVYGLAALPEAKNVYWIYRAKGRPESNPLPILLSDAKLAARFVQLTPRAKTLMQAYWPGGLTLVLPRKKGTAWGRITRGGDWIALRVPDHSGVRQIIQACGGAVIATSANPAGETAPVSAQTIDPQILAFAEGVLDTGPCKQGLNSTVVKVINRKVEILRQGSLVLPG